MRLAVSTKRHRRQVWSAKLGSSRLGLTNKISVESVPNRKIVACTFAWCVGVPKIPPELFQAAQVMAADVSTPISHMCLVRNFLYDFLQECPSPRACRCDHACNGPCESTVRPPPPGERAGGPSFQLGRRRRPVLGAAHAGIRLPSTKVREWARRRV